MEICETGIKGLLVKYDDYETTYTKAGKGELVVNGEWATGEVWINNAHYYYRRTNDKVLLEDDDGNVCFSFEDSEEGWEQFADSVI